ncbi:Holliday junction DNA helicase RuvA [Parvularcula bermudensis HTCC2503]|uniref:Holliday junction branch migration complex subunit RuvA n=1 Tax=Parvularcula bermudensis (strain ATCC BAA-594 / HTCC2503 / KCTC 12087) TaxID=314260 RepID=E0TCM0_PARBH|nr:Holliday junction branch migration protein RuvA [Parvularcula bermudensis]ADM08609.1 Holliday junction DNA helicase RuvA [Parvularcula bermudensis HTCC2503]
MIAALHGTVSVLSGENAIIDVNGVGYEVAATPRLLSSLAQGQEVRLITETLVAETYIRLVAFQTIEERLTFRLLQTVQGVGAKAALAILSALTPADLFDAVEAGDKAMVARAQGVGPKLALRIVTELKGKCGGIVGAFPAVASPRATSAAAVDSPAEDAVAALVALGFDHGAARRTISTLPDLETSRTEDLITAGLKTLAAS